MKQSLCIPELPAQGASRGHLVGKGLEMRVHLPLGCRQDAEGSRELGCIPGPADTLQLRGTLQGKVSGVTSTWCTTEYRAGHGWQQLLQLPPPPPPWQVPALEI